MKTHLLKSTHFQILEILISIFEEIIMRRVVDEAGVGERGEVLNRVIDEHLYSRQVDKKFYQTPP